MNDGEAGSINRGFSSLANEISLGKGNEAIGYISQFPQFPEGSHRLSTPSLNNSPRLRKEPNGPFFVCHPRHFLFFSGALVVDESK
jgi:hypothetical protein